MHSKDKEQYGIALREVERYRKKYDLTYQWMRLRQNGVGLIEFFQDRKLASIAIYGMGDLSQLICRELVSYGIIQYGIDQKPELSHSEFPVYSLDKVQEDVDAILITPVLITDEIEDAIYDVLGEQTTFVFEEVLFEISRKHGIPSALWPI